MKKTLLLAFSFILVASVSGLVGFYLGTQAASEFWLHQYLRQVAYDVWILERAWSSVGDASQDDEEWFKHEIRDAERALSHEEYGEFVAHDQQIQRLNKKVFSLREERTRKGILAGD